MKKEHIFFDLDGTLVDSMPGITRSVQYALHRYGIEVEDLNELKPFVGPPLHESFKEFYHFSEEEAWRAIEIFREYYTERGWLESAVFDGVEETLKRLHEVGRKLYVATSKPEHMAKQVLEHYGLSQYFECIGGAIDDNKREKKDEVIAYVMETCGLKETDSIVMVGDRRHDIAGAHKQALQAVGVLYGYGSREEFEAAGADWITETPDTLCQLLLTL